MSFAFRTPAALEFLAILLPQSPQESSVRSFSGRKIPGGCGAGAGTIGAITEACPIGAVVAGSGGACASGLASFVCLIQA